MKHVLSIADLLSQFKDNWAGRAERYRHALADQRIDSLSALVEIPPDLLFVCGIDPVGHAVALINGAKMAAKQVRNCANSFCLFLSIFFLFFRLNTCFALLRLLLILLSLFSIWNKC